MTGNPKKDYSEEDILAKIDALEQKLEILQKDIDDYLNEDEKYLEF